MQQLFSLVPCVSAAEVVRIAQSTSLENKLLVPDHLTETSAGLARHSTFSISIGTDMKRELAHMSVNLCSQIPLLLERYMSVLFQGYRESV